MQFADIARHVPGLIRLLPAVLALTGSLCWAAPSFAAFPGKNGKIAFASNRDRPDLFCCYADIYSVNPDGTAVERLTDNPAPDVSPAWSPDGAKIAFVTGRDSPPPDAPNPEPNPEIYSMASNGSGQTNLSNHRLTDLQPSWSPDGAKIVFSSGRDGADLNTFFPTTDLYVMNADGSAQTRLTFDEDTIDSNPDWSPDGTKIAFEELVLFIDEETENFASSGPHIGVLNADGSGRMFIAFSGSEPDWSPDGTKIAFVRNAGCYFGFCSHANDQIATMNADGTNQQVVENSLTDEAEPAWSPDGSKIAFTVGRYARSPEIYTMNADGTDVTNITNTPSYDEAYPDWQPLPAPRRSDFKNSAKFCNAEQEFFGEAAFGQRYGGGPNAYGKCVSRK